MSAVVAFAPGMMLPRTRPVIVRPASVAIGMAMRMRPAGTSHCQPIQTSVKPCCIRAPLPKSASVDGSSAPTPFWNTGRIRLVPRLPAS